MIKNNWVVTVLITAFTLPSASRAGDALTSRPTLVSCHEIFKSPALVAVTADTLSSEVEPIEPSAKDYQAQLKRDGYQILTDLPPLSGMTESELYVQLMHFCRLRSIYRTNCTANLIVDSDNNFYDLDDDPVYTYPNLYRKWWWSFSRVELPKPFADFLIQRVRYNAHNAPIADRHERYTSIEIRVGNFGFAPRYFHYDNGDITDDPEGIVAITETLNRSERNRGTFFRGTEGTVFEPKPGEAVYFVFENDKGIPPALHASPPEDGERIFIRYSFPLRPDLTRKVMEFRSSEDRRSIIPQ